jgi:cellobiose phosphorylase
MSNNGFFSDDFSTFTITDMHPPRPWYNLLWNDSFIAQVDQFGGGKSWFYSPAGVRANHNTTGTPSDLGTVTENRLVFLRDQETGAYWAANRNFHNEAFDTFQTLVEQGRSRIVSSFHGIDCEFALSIAADDPAECWEITVKNTGDTPRKIQLFPYAPTAFNLLPHSACMGSDWNDPLDGLLVQNNAPELNTPFRCAFMASDRAPDAWETTDRRFKGVYGLLSDPDAVRAGQLSSTGTNFEWQMCFAFQFNLTLAPGEETTVRLVSGLAETPEAATALRAKLLALGAFEKQNDTRAAARTAREERLKISTGDTGLDALTSSWLKQQVSLGREWGRVYGRGFRDMLQDCAAVASFNPDDAAEGILTCLAYQYEDGNSLRQWNPPWTHPYRDGAAWILPAVTAVLKETGDFGLLEKEVPFYESSKSGTVLDHCFQGLEFLLGNLGEHGLCLWGGGDWCDTIDGAGLDGRGESVWLTEATIVSAKLLADLLDQLNRSDEAAGYRAKANELIENLRAHAWDKDHFICGFNDDGLKIGAHESVDAKLFLNMQTWAVLSGAATDGNKLMNLIERELATPLGTVLCKPACRQKNPRIGMFSFMAPGVCENASVYCHGNAFKIVADCKLGRAEEAYDTLKKILPGNPENPDSGVEPYAVTNQYLGPENPNRAGTANGSWITGTAGWIYRAVTEHLLGLQPEYDGLHLRPCLPAAWPEVTIRRVFRDNIYNIVIRRSEKSSLAVNGKKIEGDLLPLGPRGTEHDVVLTI